jgi:2-dehydro-3-deoxyphosphogluconate aldolase/(4S)-4-hydroxy-2-oxoglutarate aldolase
LKLLEIAWDLNYAESLIPKLQQELPDCRIGTGTILDLETAERAIASGCKFLFTPHVDVKNHSTAAVLPKCRSWRGL